MISPFGDDRRAEQGIEGVPGAGAHVEHPQRLDEAEHRRAEGGEHRVALLIEGRHVEHELFGEGERRTLRPIERRVVPPAVGERRVRCVAKAEEAAGQPPDQHVQRGVDSGWRSAFELVEQRSGLRGVASQRVSSGEAGGPALIVVHAERYPWAGDRTGRSGRRALASAG